MELSQARVIRHESDDWSWEFIFRDPHPRLRPFVRSYVGFSERTARPARRIESATDDVVLVLNFGSRMHVVDPRDPSTEDRPVGSFAAGLYDSYVITGLATESRGLEVKLSPLGARKFFGMPLSEIANRTVDISDVLGSDLLIEELAAMPTWESRFAKLNEYIGQQLGCAHDLDRLVADAVRRLEQTAGSASIHSIALEVGYDAKQFAGHFQREIGLTPKRFARILRFKEATRKLSLVQAPLWVEIAHASGYYDQSHFNREFREFTGYSPSEYIARLLPDHGGVSGS